MITITALPNIIWVERRRWLLAAGEWRQTFIRPVPCGNRKKVSPVTQHGNPGDEAAKRRNKTFSQLSAYSGVKYSLQQETDKWIK